MTRPLHRLLLLGLASLCLLFPSSSACLAADEPPAPAGPAVRVALVLDGPALPARLSGWRPTSLSALFEEAQREGEPPRLGEIPVDPGSAAREVHWNVREWPDRPLFTRGEMHTWAIGTAIAIATDRRTVRWFDPELRGDASSGNGGGKAVSKLGTGMPIVTAIALPGLIDGRYGRRTSALAVVAVLDAGLLTTGIKLLTGRERPYESFGSTQFHGPSTQFDSFPSGHTAAAFAVATVLGSRYPKYRLALYILASAVGWARINAARHFPSDAFVGAGAGVFAGRYVMRHGARLWTIRF